VEAHSEKKKYINYLGRNGARKPQSASWKLIMSDEHLSEEEKYQQLVRKVQKLEARAYKKENNVTSGDANEEALNYYIGSIQAKLTLLEQF
jgi:hypothetical protein